MVLIEVPDRLEVRVTLAPGTAPPLESSTVPISTAVDTCAWPSDPEDMPLRRRNTPNAVRAALDFMTPSLRNSRAPGGEHRVLWIVDNLDYTRSMMRVFLSAGTRNYSNETAAALAAAFPV